MQAAELPDAQAYGIWVPLLSLGLGLGLAAIGSRWLLPRAGTAAKPRGAGSAAVEAAHGVHLPLGYEPEAASCCDEDLQIAYKEERQANIAKIDFMARMSHELRTPLNAISGFAQLIRDQRFGPQAMDRYSDYAADIVKSSEHLLSMINELLDLSKIEANRVELHPEPILLPTFLGDTLRLLRAEADESRVRLELAPCQADLTLTADRRALTQILLNLLSNAIKYTEAGGRVRLSAVTRNRGTVIEVSDTGVGMSAEQVDQAFQAFVRSEDPLVRSREGTGLGLPIAKHLLELHGGRIVLKSRPGRGTRATLWLPKTPPAIVTHDPTDHALAS